MKTQSHILALLLSAALALTACGDIKPAPLASVSAQPKTPAQRNITPFYPALQCMDNLFLKAGRRTVLVSANQIPDKTRRVPVDARSMIITALNHMTRRSRAFQFVEQGIHSRTNGETLVLEKDLKNEENIPVRPILYFSGSISQVDTAVQERSLELAGDIARDENLGLIKAEIPKSLQSSIVTLDLHLVRFPSRIVVPRSAISNSMVVSTRRWQSGFAGVISQRPLGFELQIERVESQGQAVRSLIELGLIEMLGTYAGVPFWECLSRPGLNATATARDERRHRALDPSLIKEAQETLHALGYRDVVQSGQLNKQTRRALAHFQAHHGLLSNGSLDFDTQRLLRQKRPQMISGANQAPKRREPKQPPAIAPKVPKRDDGYKSLGAFLEDSN